MCVARWAQQKEPVLIFGPRFFRKGSRNPGTGAEPWGGCYGGLPALGALAAPASNHTRCQATHLSSISQNSTQWHLVYSAPPPTRGIQRQAWLHGGHWVGSTAVAYARRPMPLFPFVLSLGNLSSFNRLVPRLPCIVFGRPARTHQAVPVSICRP